MWQSHSPDPLLAGRFFVRLILVAMHSSWRRRALSVVFRVATGNVSTPAADSLVFRRPSQPIVSTVSPSLGDPHQIVVWQQGSICDAMSTTHGFEVRISTVSRIRLERSDPMHDNMSVPLACATAGRPVDRDKMTKADGFLGAASVQGKWRIPHDDELEERRSCQAPIIRRPGASLIVLSSSPASRSNRRTNPY